MYAKWTLKALRDRDGQVELPDLVNSFPKGTYETEARQLWVYLHIRRELLEWTPILRQPVNP